MKKTNKKPARPGGVLKDPSVRVKVKSSSKEMDVSVSDEPIKKKKKKKKKVAEAEPEVVVKKKKKKKGLEKLGTALALFEPSVKAKKLSRVDTTEMDTIVGDSSEDIQQLINDGNNDAAIPLMYKTMMRMIVDVLPYAEAQIRNTKGAKGVYQINSLISSLRELMADIQMAQDRGALGQNLLLNIIRPAILDLAMDTLQIYALINDDAKNFMTEANHAKYVEVLRSHRDKQAGKMNDTYAKISEGVIKFLEN